MFDLTNVDIRIPGEIKVKQFRAATDDSIRLADEFYQKAKDSLIAKEKIELNYLKGDIFIFNQIHSPEFRLKLNWLFRFKLNDKEISINGTINEDDYYLLNSNERYEFIVKLILKDLSTSIGMELIKGSLPEINKINTII